MSIIIQDIDSIIIDKCDSINDFLSIRCVNHNLYKLVINNLLFIEWQQFNSIHENINFLDACRFGYFIICKYLLRTKIINIHANDEYAFKWSCFNNHHNIAKWLIKLGSKPGFGQIDQKIINRYYKKIDK